MTGHSWKQPRDGARHPLESPMPDHRVRLCPELADGVAQVSDA